MTKIPKNAIDGIRDRAWLRGAAFGLAVGISLGVLYITTVKRQPIMPSLSWQKAMRSIGENVCLKNGGLREIAIEPEPDVYSFHCKDGLSLRDTVAQIK